MTEQTYYRWKREYGGLRTDQAKRRQAVEHVHGVRGIEEAMNVAEMLRRRAAEPIPTAAGPTTRCIRPRTAGETRSWPSRRLAF